MKTSTMELTPLVYTGLLLLGFLAMRTKAGIFLPKRSYEFNVTKLDDPPMVYFLRNDYLQCDTVGLSAAIYPNTRGVIAVLSWQKSYILLELDSRVDWPDRLEFELRINCNDKSVQEMDLFLPLLKSNININFVTQLNADVDMDNVIRRHACLQQGDLTYDIIENSIGGFLDELFPNGKSRDPGNVEDTRLSLNIDQENTPITELFAIEASNLLKLIGPLDREAQPDLIQFPVRCSLTNGDQESINVFNVKVKIYDTDDMLPHYYRGKNNTTIPISNVKLGTTPTIYMLDDDSTDMTSNKTYRITKNDPINAMAIMKINFRKFRTGTFISVKVRLFCYKSFVLPYETQVILEDLTYSPTGPRGKPPEKHIFKLIIDKDSTQSDKQSDKHTFKLNSEAAKYALIGKLNIDGSTAPKNVRWDITSVAPRTYKDIVGITSSGEIYVRDTTRLQSTHADVPLLSAKALRYEGAKQTNAIQLEITILRESSSAKEHIPCDQGCNKFNNEEQCTSSCGYGALTGRCQWYRMRPVLASETPTFCGPNLDHCPDGICSELEKMDESICPQDCKPDNTSRSWSSRRADYRHEAKDPCWCASPEDPKCAQPRDESTDLPSALININKSTTTVGINSPTARTGTVVQNNFDGQAKDSNEPVCSDTCRAGIAGAAAILLIAVIVAFMARRVWRKRRYAEPPALKHVGSSVSMAAIPSDYIMDDSREQRPHILRQTPSPAPGQWISKMVLCPEVDEKWEFPRNQLMLEDGVLGEGEFGQVLRAEAKGMNGNADSTTVAIKMLKPDASGAEYQDLISEFNMLKEVDHPNVIKLLGVCTIKGPLYVIVEYCELGCLRSFLRSSKFKNKGGWDEKQRHLKDSMTSLQECRNLTVRDFFSFAWQISKGMEYLAGLKIVHRDLAARNVLVTENLQAKISDFGLSRDVYEAETYLRMSKGRIPVKWMAPESLYAQIYTTKSDIWSYGIVLWEIATLGASPYPGIPPERLFPLISTGYRMDRPDECPDEFYAIMQKCWKFAPEDRPSFFTLRNILDHFLQKRAEYLELSNNTIFTPEDLSHEQNDYGRDASDNNRKGFTGYTNDGVGNGRYNNICPKSQTVKKPYVVPQWPGDGESDNECPESSHLLPPTQQEGHSKDHSQTDTDNLHLRKKEPRVQRVMVHENLTYA